MCSAEVKERGSKGSMARLVTFCCTEISEGHTFSHIRILSMAKNRVGGTAYCITAR